MKKDTKETQFFASILPALVADLQKPDRGKVLRALEVLAAYSANAAKALPMLLKLNKEATDRHVVRGTSLTIKKIKSRAVTEAFSEEPELVF